MTLQYEINDDVYVSFANDLVPARVIDTDPTCMDGNYYLVEIETKTDNPVSVWKSDEEVFNKNFLDEMELL